MEIILQNSSRTFIRCIFPRSLPLFIVNFFYYYSFSILKLLVVIAHARRCIALIDDENKKIWQKNI